MENKKKHKYIFVRDESGEIKRVKCYILSKKNKSERNIFIVKK